MRESAILLYAALAGLILGVIFFGGLWWTVRRGVSSQRPAVWFVGSLLARMILVVAGFYFVSSGDWRRLVAGLLGFIAARVAAIRLMRAPLAGKNGLEAEEGR